MFASSVVESDAFIDMPLTAQALYFHLGMAGDDDGVVDAPKRIMRSIGCSEDDMRILAAKGFVIPFESGVVVLRHWRVCNYLRNDRYKPSMHQCELSALSLDEGNAYVPVSGENALLNSLDTVGIPAVYQRDTQLTELTELTERNRTNEGGGFSPPSVEDVSAYADENGLALNADRFIDYYESNGWRVGSNPMRDWKAAARNWARRDEQRTDRGWAAYDGEYANAF